MKVETIIKPKIHEGKYSDLALDPRNPRLGRKALERELTQTELLEHMKDWSLEELGTSFIESGFWPQEPLVVVKEEIQGEPANVVVEGNRRLAALMLLHQAFESNPVSAAWAELAEQAKPAVRKRLRDVYYVMADSRADVDAYLGFRHVTGIKPWNPAEKAEFIAKLVKGGKTFEQVARLIGSKPSHVRQNYAAFNILLQMEGVEEVEVPKVEEKFGVLFRALNTTGVQKFLGVELGKVKESTRKPIAPEKKENLGDFSRWMFGTDTHAPVVTDSRMIDQFAEILSSKEAVAYLRRQEEPVFETAYRIAGGEVAKTADILNRAADEVESALSTVHKHVAESSVQNAVERLADDVSQLLSLFPEIKKRHFEAGK